MDQNPAALSLPAPPSDAVLVDPPRLPRWVAIFQVVLVCGIPTQIAIWLLLEMGAGLPVMQDGDLSFTFFVTLSLLDTALVALLIHSFLLRGGETLRTVAVGNRRIAPEVRRGLLWLPVVFVGTTGAVLVIRAIAPWMHNVPESPFEAFLRTPIQAAIFLVVVILAGGVREELQRAFILHRFEQRLGGIKLGLLFFSLLFAALHVDQGYDVVVSILLLALFWGVLYIRQRSAIAPMVNHAAFNAAQVVQTVLVKGFGGFGA